MKNVRYSIEGDELVIRVNTKEDHGKSSTGKTLTVASSQGFQKIEGAQGISFSLNVNKKAA